MRCSRKRNGDAQQVWGKGPLRSLMLLPAALPAMFSSSPSATHLLNATSGRTRDSSRSSFTRWRSTDSPGNLPLAAAFLPTSSRPDCAYSYQLPPPAQRQLSSRTSIPELSPLSLKPDTPRTRALVSRFSTDSMKRSFS